MALFDDLKEAESQPQNRWCAVCTWYGTLDSTDQEAFDRHAAQLPHLRRGAYKRFQEVCTKNGMPEVSDSWFHTHLKTHRGSR